MLNKVILMGRLTADPELKQTPAGVSVASFRLACDRNYTDKSGNRECDFINVVAWRNTAEFISRYFQKGRMIALEGSIQTRGYTDKDGNKRTVFEVVAEQVYFADSKQEEEPVERTKKEFAIDDFEECDSIDDIPF